VMLVEEVQHLPACAPMTLERARSLAAERNRRGS
jgi:hypothetical protein